MRLEWIEDILSVLDAGSLAGAAERRYLTQSAFTRRVRSIEAAVGVTLFDRSRKPVTLMPGVAAMEPELRRIAADLRRIGQGLRQTATPAGHVLTITCQHALATSLSARIVGSLSGLCRVHMRAGDRDECLMQLVSGKADIALIYEVPDDRLPGLAQIFETASIGTDRLVAVAAPGTGGSPVDLSAPVALPSVVYPHDAFLGRAFDRHIAPRLSEGVTLDIRAETALTPGMVQLALDGIGVAWLPETLVSGHLASGRLVRVAQMPDLRLGIVMIRLGRAKDNTPLTEAWQTLAALS